MDDMALLYLEADDEVTSVARRLRTASEPRVVIVAPGRSRATSSVVALRLLGRIAAAEGREIAVVGDALTRSLAGEAGLVAYLTVDDARRAEPDHAADAPQRAGIHVVRGSDAFDDSAPTAAAVAEPERDPASDETRAVIPARAAAVTAAPLATPRRRRRPLPAVIGAVVLALLLLAAGVAAAVVLPAARVAVVPRTLSIVDQAYTIDAAGAAERRTGIDGATATVTATGSYPITETAVGTVVFRNFSGAPVEVPAGTLVAAEEQAFETVLSIVVPAGLLTPNGQVQAGEASTDVMASAPGLAGNVPANSINAVLSDGPEAGLRGFSNNAQQLVINPEATAGGREDTGIEFTQQDVDAAVASLRAELLAQVERLVDAEDALVVGVGADREPALEGLDELVGKRDQPEAEIRASLAYDRWLVDRDELARLAVARLSQDDRVIADGYRLIDEETLVEITGAIGTESGVEVMVLMRGRAVAELDEPVVVERIRGLPREAARAALADLGTAAIDLWPGWVSAVPELEWRIDVTIDGAQNEPLPSRSP